MSAIVQRSLFEGPDRSLPDNIGGAAVRSIETTNLLTPGQGRISAFDFALNPYRGCTFGCSYCYAAFFVPEADLRENWGRWVEVKSRAVETLRHRNLEGKTILMSSATDPYQPIEARLELTREILEVLAGSGARVVIQTRSPLAARDIDIFSKFKHIKINMSITTDDEEIRKRFEPGCASIGRRVEAVARLNDAGLKTSVCVSPMLPMKDPYGFGARLAKMGVDYLTTAWFHMNDKPFSSGTRDPAIQLLDETGWNYERYVRARDALKRGFGKGPAGSGAFAPV